MPLAASLEIPPLITSSTSPRNSGVSECPRQDAPKKKRSRVTKEQLAHLERLFATDCSPTTTRRREISLRIGMPERQIQIWFQNHRAKAKSAVDRNKTQRIVSSLVRPPELSKAVQAEFAALIQEDDPIIFVIPCTYLTIGGWNRVGGSNCDLLAWICETRRCLTWFVQSKEHSFKMQVPLDCVVELDFKNANPGRGILGLSISQCPMFFSRRDMSLSGGAPPSCWKACGDWTENREASLGLWHALEGPARPLAYIVGYIKDRITPMTKPVDRQPLSCPMIKYPQSSTLLYPASSRSQSRCPPGCDINPRLRNGTPHHAQRTDIPNKPKPLFSSFPDFAIPSPSRPLALHVISDPQRCDDRARFTGVGPASGNPSPSLIQQRPSYSSAQTSGPNCHLSPLLPDLSELFSSPKSSP